MHPLTSNPARQTQPREDGVYRTVTDDLLWLPRNLRRHRLVSAATCPLDRVGRLSRWSALIRPSWETPTKQKPRHAGLGFRVGSLTMTYFRAVYPALSSALRRFTVLFGMGRRGANALWSSEKTVAAHTHA